MTISPAGIQFLKNEEGLRLKAYLDGANVATIGFGSTRYEDGSKVKMGDRITIKRAMQLLSRDAARRSEVLNRLLGPVKLNQNQFDALVSLMYNIGIEALRKSTVLSIIKANPFSSEIPKWWAVWNKIRSPKTGKLEVSKGLQNRRAREISLFLTKPV